MPAWLKILLFVGVLGILATGIISFFNESASEVVQGQVEAIRNNKLTEAYYEFTSQEFQKSTTLDEFKEFIKQIFAILQTDESFHDYNMANDTKVVRATFDNHDQPVILDFRLVKQEGKWKILNIRWLGSKQQDMPEPALNEPNTPVSEFLDLIQNKQLEEAYNLTTSTEFKSTIPYSVFSDFVNTIFIFGEFTSYKIVTTALEQNMAIIKVLLHENENISHVQFITLIEDHEWRIRGIEILSSDTIKNLQSYKSDDLTKPISNFLEGIKKGNVQEAYENYTTEGFRNVTSLEQLEKFLKSYDFLVEHEKINIYKIAFDNNIAIVSSQLIAHDKLHEIQFFLMQENDEWKIIQLKILDTENGDQARLG